MGISDLLSGVKANLYRATAWSQSVFDMPDSPLRWQSWTGKGSMPPEPPPPPPSPADLLSGNGTPDWQEPPAQAEHQAHSRGASL
jgi:hypothetical protein